LQVRGLIARRRSGLLDRLSAVRRWDLAQERGTGRVGSGENSTVGWAAQHTQRLGRDHNCFHGDGDGGGPAVRGVRVSLDPGGDRLSRAACGMGAVEGRAQAGLRGAPRSWQMVPAVRGGRCRERQGRRRHRGGRNRSRPPSTSHTHTRRFIQRGSMTMRAFASSATPRTGCSAGAGWPEHGRRSPHRPDRRLRTSAAGWSGRGGWRWRLRWGRRPLHWASYPVRIECGCLCRISSEPPSRGINFGNALDAVDSRTGWLRPGARSSLSVGHRLTPVVYASSGRTGVRALVPAY